MTAHEFDVREFGACLTCGSDDEGSVCAPPGGECDDCGVWCAGAALAYPSYLCDACARELGGEA